MKTWLQFNSRASGFSGLAAGIAIGVAMMLTSLPTIADPVTMAPPVAQATASAPGDNVFNWSEVPQNQQVPITRGAFDQGGYQLFDNVGETIVVPFTNNNLYVMKFAVSDNGSMYFVNAGDSPILYVPQGGYLENLGVPGAKWYPFNTSFHPVTPVYVGIAPSWSAYCGMGWYPDMVCYGGYWGPNAFVSGGIFVATGGFAVFIGGTHFYGWGPYHDYYFAHPAPYHVAFYDRNVYHYAARAQFGGGRAFGHVSSPAYSHRSFSSAGGGHVFRGSSGHSWSGSHGGGGGGFHGGGSSHGGGGFHGGGDHHDR